MANQSKLNFLLHDGSFLVGKLRVFNPSKELKVRHSMKELPDDVLENIKLFVGVKQVKLKEELDRKIKMVNILDKGWGPLNTTRLEALIQVACPVVIRSTKKLFILEEEGKKARHFYKDRLYPYPELREYNVYNRDMIAILRTHYKSYIHHPKFDFTPRPSYYIETVDQS